MRVKLVEIKDDGDNFVVSLRTVTNHEILVVPRRFVYNGAMDVSVVAADKDAVLVDLPVDTLAGARRVWIHQNQIVKKT